MVVSAIESLLRRLRDGALLGVLSLGAIASANTSAVAPPLERPALQTPRAQRAVLQAAAQAGQRLVAAGERGVVLISDDAGRQWRQVRTPTSVGLTALHFVDAQHGWAVGHGGVVLATNDGGNTWRRQLDGVQIARLLVAAARESGSEKAIADAQRLLKEGPDKPLLDAHFFDAKHGWVVGAFNFALTTEDGGSTWRVASSRLDNPKQLHLYALRARGDTLLIAGEQGLVLLSRDRGRTFRRLAVPYTGSFFTAEVSGDQELLVAGMRGNVWSSHDGGASWLQVVGGPPVNITASALDESGRVVLANQAGAVLAVRRDALVPVADRLPPLNGLIPLRGEHWLGVSFAGPVPFKVQLPEAVK